MDSIILSGIEVKAVTIVGPKPEDVPTGWHVYNAPRPLWGHMEWIGDFISGVFFVAVDPNGERALEMVERNRSLDARELLYITEDIFNEDVDRYASMVAQEYGVDVDSFDREDIEASYFNFEHNEGRRILRRP